MSELALSQILGTKDSSVISEKLSAATSSDSSVLGDGWRQDRQEFRATLSYSRPRFWERRGRGEKEGEGGFQWYQDADAAAGRLPSSGSALSNDSPCTRQSRHLTTPNQHRQCTPVVHQYPPCGTCLQFKAKSLLVIGTTHFLAPQPVSHVAHKHAHTNCTQ